MHRKYSLHKNLTSIIIESAEIIDNNFILYKFYVLLKHGERETDSSVVFICAMFSWFKNSQNLFIEQKSK